MHNIIDVKLGEALIGHAIVEDLRVVSIPIDAITGKIIRWYRNENGVDSFARCEAWLAGYSAKEREIKDRSGHTATSSEYKPYPNR